MRVWCAGKKATEMIGLQAHNGNQYMPAISKKQQFEILRINLDSFNNGERAQFWPTYQLSRQISLICFVSESKRRRKNTTQSMYEQNVSTDKSYIDWHVAKLLCIGLAINDYKSSCWFIMDLAEIAAPGWMHNPAAAVRCDWLLGSRKQVPV